MIERAEIRAVEGLSPVLEANRDANEGSSFQIVKPRVDPAQARAFLSAALDREVTELREIASGEWSQAFSFVAGAEAKIVRFGARPDDFLLDRFAAQLAARSPRAALPIPRVSQIGEGLDLHYAVSDRHFGEFLEGGSEQQMRRKLPALFATLDALREIDTSATSGFGPWLTDGSGAYATWRGALLDVVVDRPGARIHGWRAKLASRPAAEDSLLTGFAYLEQSVARCPELRHVIHSDLIHQNVLVLNDRISAIFDWGCAMYGDFLYDLAWLTFWSPWHPELRHIELRGLARAHYREIGLEVPDFEARMRCCELHIGLAAQAYNAFTERWEELEQSGRRTLECAAGLRELQRPDG